MAADRVSGYTRVEMRLGKWENGRTPADGEPDEVVTRVYWTGPDGSEVTDEAAIAELAARYDKEQ